MENITRAIFGFCLLLLSSTAAAVAITGTINIGGGSQVITDASGNSIGVDFNCGATCGGSVNTFPAPSGSFAGLGGLNTLPGGGLTLNSFLYSEIPSKTIWSIDYNGLLYTFTLTSLQIIDPNLSTLSLAGSGYFNITNSNGTSAGYTTGYGSWLYTQSGASFSSQSVPEPGTIALVGLGLVGIGAIRRFRKAA
jgi:hypothetical protein